MRERRRLDETDCRLGARRSFGEVTRRWTMGIEQLRLTIPPPRVVHPYRYAH